MESPIYVLDRKVQQRGGDNMSTSINSTLDDTTPSDSGIQLLDSESSELMVESITSQAALEFDDNKSIVQEDKLLAEMCDEKLDNLQLSAVDANNQMSKEHIEISQFTDSNSNVTTNTAVVDDSMSSSNCSTFDTENIVYRRKVRKTQVNPKPVPKKRVSFHEDILKNTRTDNIHIEHGFITYKNGRKIIQKSGGIPGRYSWCSGGDNAAAVQAADNSEMLCLNQEEGDIDQSHMRRLVYRNAFSDVLDYGNSDVFDTNEGMNYLHYNNSGVFEYDSQHTPHTAIATDGNVKKAFNLVKTTEPGQVLYKCSCSSSNSSLDSDENDKNSNRQQYGQAKSSSCDCIGSNQANNNLIGDNCYFSEPNMGNLNEAHKKSVWNKEKKPKSSCLKKTKRHTNIIQEQDLNTKVKKFNVHNMNQLLDNSSKMIFGSLKSIFTIPLPERGVPEGSEDVQSVIECIPELDQTPEHKMEHHHHNHPNSKQWTSSSPISPTNLKGKPFLSKSLDGSNNASNQITSKNFVHNVDEQLRRKNENEMYAPTRQNSDQEQKSLDEVKRQEETENITANEKNNQNADSSAAETQRQFRNKFIINCESTVFEHTGVSYCYDENSHENGHENGCEMNAANVVEKETPMAQAEPDQLARGTFITVPIKKTFSNFFRSFKESTITPISAKTKNIPNNTAVRNNKDSQKTEAELKTAHIALLPKMDTSTEFAKMSIPKKMLSTTPSSTVSEHTTTATAATSSNSIQKSMTTSGVTSSTSLEKQSRHLPSPLKKRQLTGGMNMNIVQTTALPPRYESHNSSRMSPDLFNIYAGTRGGSGRDSKSTILSEEFDDILTITTDNDKTESDIVMIDYPELIDRNSSVDYTNLLRPPQTKASLINRFLRNVTQKKILETSIRKNNFFANKLKSEHKLFANSLYVPGAKPQNFELIDDLNAEIAMEIEMSGANSPRRELANIDTGLQDDASRFELGIGEISIDIFNGNYLPILRDTTEQLMKVFKLYTGYSKEGFMTPVLVLLTDKALYVADLVRNRLCSKFVLAYDELDVILLGPHGNTVLLSNSTRDKQQVLLAGGPYPADSLVANLELCARRSGSILPAVGQLTLEHLEPLQAFVREKSCVTKDDSWVYYAVVHVPSTGTIGIEQEPLGPHIKGFLMHRRVKEHSSSHHKSHWSPGYFLLKAGVLYMFNDSTRRLPSWAMALAECQGARRSVRTGRPHCFEIILNNVLLQLAAPDEYVASEWLQALLQSASGLFEMQEKHRTLGRTLVVTQHRLITLREDFSAPLRIINTESGHALKPEDCLFKEPAELKLMEDNQSLISSTLSTPTKGGGGTLRSCSSMNSTPTKLSQLSRSTTTFNNSASTNVTSTNPTATSTVPNNGTTTCSKHSKEERKTNFPGMSSVYGGNSGLEILTCADIKEMTGIKIPSHTDTWWCILEFSYQEVRECSDDLAIFFASGSEMHRFLGLLEKLWQAKNNDLFPIMILDEDDVIAEQCTMLYMDINRSWEPLLSAALGYPL